MKTFFVIAAICLGLVFGADSDAAPVDIIAPVCPLPLCIEPQCENPEPGYIEVDGRRCPGCPICPKPPLPCPVFRCANPGCPNPKPSYFYLEDGTRCLGCPICPKPCPLIRCYQPLLACSKPLPYSTMADGVRCPGCPRCPRRCDLLICPACAPPPNYVPEYDKYGCRKCPPCGFTPLEEAAVDKLSAE